MEQIIGQWNTSKKKERELIIKKRTNDKALSKTVAIHRYLTKSSCIMSTIFAQEITRLQNFIVNTKKKKKKKLIAIDFIDLILKQCKKSNHQIKRYEEWPEVVLIYWKMYYNELIMTQLKNLNFPEFKSNRFLIKSEFEALIRAFFHFNGAEQKNFTQKYAEKLQKALIKLHSKYDISLQRIQELGIEKVLFDNLNKANTTGGLDSIQIYKLQNTKKLVYNFTTLKLGNTAKNEFYSYHHRKDNGNFSSRWYENFHKASLEENLVLHIDLMLKSLPLLSASNKKIIKKGLLLRYRFVQDSVGGDFLNKLNQQSKFNLEKSITQAIHDSKCKIDCLDGYMTGLIKFNQLIELIQNGGTRQITKNQNKYYKTSDEVLSYIELSINNKKTFDNFKFHASSFYPTIEIKNNNLFVSVKGFEPKNYNKDSQLYLIAKSLNSLITQLSKVMSQEFDSLSQIEVVLKSPEKIIELITAFQRKLLKKIIQLGFVQEFTAFWNEKESTFSFSTTTEYPLKTSKVVSKKMTKYSVYPYDIIQHWDFPTKNKLKDLLKINTFISEIWADYYKSIFQVIKRKELQNIQSKLNKNFDNTEIDLYKKGLAILKSTSSSICLPGSGMGNAHLFFRQKRNKIVFTVLSEEGDIISIEKHGRPSVLYYEFDHELWFRHNRSYAELILPLWFNWDNDILRVRFQSGNKTILKYWLRTLEKEYGLPKRVIKKMKDGVVLNQVDHELIVVFVLICKLFLKNWNEYLDTMWESCKIRDWLETIDIEIIRSKSNNWKVIHNKKAVKVYPAIAKKRSQSNKIQSGPFLVPYSNTIFGHYINELEERLNVLLSKNLDDEGVKIVNKWYKKIEQ